MKTIPLDNQFLAISDVLLSPEETDPDEVIALVTQELRTSLTPIRGTLGLLQSGGIESTSEQGQRLLTIAMNNTQRLLRLISAIEQQVALPLTLLSHTTIERIQLEVDLQLAWERQEFFLVYQPIVQIQTGKIIGFETLVRWQHPTRGVIAPNVFIPIAEESGLICSLGIWILEQACYQLQEWQRLFPCEPPLMLSVNLSSWQLLSPDFAQNVQNIIHKTNISPSCLKLEITETALIQNYELANQTINDLKALGIQFYIDDFGTGYSSLSRLQDLPIDALKIDRSFVQKKKWDISETIICLATKLGLDVIAEGVESYEELTLLQEIGCHQVQGYYFSMPLDKEKATSLLLDTVLSLSSLLPK